MNIFDNYTHDLLVELNNNNVEYIVVGGYAVNFHGYRRTTGDIDLWIKPDNNINKKNILQSLKKLNVEDSVISQLNELDFSKPIVFIDGEQPYKIDFMTYISGVNFNDAWEQKTIALLDGISIPFIHLNHLIVSKITTGRTQDKIDIEELQKIQKLKGKE
jgi:predicted nucleotidyltransferase